MSKIAVINTYLIVAKLKSVQYTAQESRAEAELLLVEVITDDGVKGYGQITSTPLPDLELQDQQDIAIDGHVETFHIK